ncbi:MAG TPA: hypothetical protein VM925_04960, partial [Labilithrix sp.]|nr:hypothetical protein [Labilithrix sp.]
DLPTENPSPEGVEPMPGHRRAEQLTPPLGILPTPVDALIDPRMARSWDTRPARWFLATTVDVGFVYARPRASVGYGKPFTSWAGLDVNPLATGNGLGAYGGLRIELPYVDLRVGARYFRAFTRTYLAPQPSYDRLQLETESGALARVLTLESELDVSIPAGPGNVLARASASYLTNVPDGMYVFEETLRVIVKPPLVWRGRAGYALRFGRYSQHSIGFVVDVLDVPARDDSRTVRLGPIVRLVLSRRVELRGSFVTSVFSPDRIGLLSGDFTELGVRYRWATE